MSDYTPEDDGVYIELPDGTRFAGDLQVQLTVIRDHQEYSFFVQLAPQKDTLPLLEVETSEELLVILPLGPYQLQLRHEGGTPGEPAERED